MGSLPVRMRNKKQEKIFDSKFVYDKILYMPKKQKSFKYRGLILAFVGVLVGVALSGTTAMFIDGPSIIDSDKVDSSTTQVVATAQADINADGTDENIALSLELATDPLDRAIYSWLIVNNQRVLVSGVNPLKYIGIVDFDVSDSKREIAISDLGPSGDYTTNFYSFDGSSIIHLGETQGLFDQVQFLGDRTFITITRASIIDTWFYKDIFQLNAENKIERVPQVFYERIGTNPVKVLAEFSLQVSPTDSTAALLLTPDEEVTIIGCDDIAWCQIETSSGGTGWFAIEQFNILKNTGKPITDYLEGLSYAD